MVEEKAVRALASAAWHERRTNVVSSAFSCCEELVGCWIDV